MRFNASTVHSISRNPIARTAQKQAAIKISNRIQSVHGPDIHLMDPTQHSTREEIAKARNTAALDQTHLQAFVARIVDRYEHFYQKRSEIIKSDPVLVACSPFSTYLERAVHWVSGWRPNTLIHLLYTESGIKFEAQLYELLIGSHSGDIGDISLAQLNAIDDLQRRVVKKEVEIDEEMARVQENAPDPFVPSDSDLDLKMEEMGRVIVKADRLRMWVLKELVAVLEPVQVLDLLVAVADWEIGVSGLGFELQMRPIRFRR